MWTTSLVDNTYRCSRLLSYILLGLSFPGFSSSFELERHLSMSYDFRDCMCVELGPPDPRSFLKIDVLRELPFEIVNISRSSHSRSYRILQARYSILEHTLSLTSPFVANPTFEVIFNIARNLGYNKNL